MEYPVWELPHDTRRAKLTHDRPRKYLTDIVDEGMGWEIFRRNHA